MQTIDEMLQAGASREEAEAAIELFKVLRPGLKVRRTGRIDTAYGDKTPLGLYRTIKAVMEKSKAKEEESAEAVKPKIKLVIDVTGGCVQAVHATPGYEWTVITADWEGDEPEALEEVEQDMEGLEAAY